MRDYVCDGPYYRFGEEPRGWKPLKGSLQSDFWNYTKKINRNASLAFGTCKIDGVLGHRLPFIRSYWEKEKGSYESVCKKFGRIRVLNILKKNRITPLTDDRTMRWNNNHICRRCGFTGRKNYPDCPRCQTKGSMDSSPWWKELPRQKKDWKKMAQRPWCKKCKELASSCYCNKKTFE